MAEIRDISTIGGKWKKNAAAAGEDYKAGVMNPKKDWAENTAGAEKNYEAGVEAGMQRKAFGKGVKKAGNETWQNGAVNKGGARFAGGVTASGDKYAENFAPFHAVIKNTVLPARGPKGSDANFERVKKMGQALHAKKLSM